jgi:hypothetical protein
LRLLAASCTIVHGHGGTQLMAKLSGLARRTVYSAKKELATLPDRTGKHPSGVGVRKKGSGAKIDPDLRARQKKALNGLIEPHVCGDPILPLRLSWAWSRVTSTRAPSPPPRRGSRRFSLRRKKFHGMEVEFGDFSWHGTQIVRFFQGMEATFSKSSTAWKALLSPLSAPPLDKPPRVFRPPVFPHYGSMFRATTIP